MRVHSFTLKSTDYCNLACTYCYSPNTKKVNYIRTDVLEKLGQRMVSDFSPDQIFQIVWHGSEPMAVGVEFYRQATQIFKSYVGERIGQHMQTNLTLVDDEWTTFFKEENFGVSTSIDGPRQVHDYYRIDHAGRGSYDKVITAIHNLKAADIDVSAITVVTKANIQYAREIYYLVRDLNINLRINPVIVAEESSFCLPSEAYGEFVISVANEWLQDTNAKFFLEPIRSMVLRLTTGQNLLCEQQALCYSHLTGIGTDGSLYPCNRFINVPELKLGHIDETNPLEIPLLPISQKAARRHINAKCQNCKLLEVCQGGCMYHSHVIYGDAFREDYFCKSYVLLYDFIIANLPTLLSRLSAIPGGKELDNLVSTLMQPVAV